MDAEKASGAQHAGRKYDCSSCSSSIKEDDRATLNVGSACDQSEKDTKFELNVSHLDHSTSVNNLGPTIAVVATDDDFIEGGFAGWKAVVGCSLISAPTVVRNTDYDNAPGWNLSWGVFQAYHSSHFLRHTPDATLSSVGAVQNALMAVVAFIAGKLGDRYGYKPFIGTGCIIVFVGQLLASWCKDFWSIFLTQGVLQGLGCGLLLPMTFAIPSQWFRRHRGVATGIVIAGAALGGAVTSLVIQ
ncbi:hypothetical protein FRC09_013054, partial [Ceratobasidium sp. 395]